MAKEGSGNIKGSGKVSLGRWFEVTPEECEGVIMQRSGEERPGCGNNINYYII